MGASLNVIEEHEGEERRGLPFLSEARSAAIRDSGGVWRGAVLSSRRETRFLCESRIVQSVSWAGMGRLN